MKQVAVLGLGDFGTALCRELKANKVTVLAVDISRARAESLKDTLEHLVVADITQTSALEQLGLAQMDVVVVATSATMPTSVLSVLRLKDLGVKDIVAKAENEDHAKVLRALGVENIVIPASDSAARLANKISWTHVVEMIELSSGCSIMEMAPPKTLIGVMLRDSKLREKYQLQVLAIRERLGAPLEPIPDPDRKLTEGCTVVVFGEDKNLARLRKQVAR